MSKSPIEWTEETWNPVRGCSPVSPGCKNCYAERTAGRFSAKDKPFHGFVQIGKNGESGPHWTGKVELIPHMLDIPMRRRKPTTYFVNSMSDLFHEDLPFDDISQVFAVMAVAKEHTFQVLTKRPDIMLGWHQTKDVRAGKVTLEGPRIDGLCPDFAYNGPLPLSNVWLGVSVEDQERKNRINVLREVPAAIRFLSLEPLLEDLGTLDLRGIDWVIVGGESGPGARQCNTEWIRSIVQQCQSAAVPVFVKQLGARSFSGHSLHKQIHHRTTDGNLYLKLKDRKGSDPSEWPPDLRVRETPAAGDKGRL